MNYKIILASLLILNVSHLPAAAYCPEGNPRTTNYIHRKTPNRCEGIKPEPISGNSLTLISIVTQNLVNYGKTLTLQIPQIRDGKNPQVVVQSFGDNYRYQLNDLSLSNNDSRFSFSWDTYVLREAKIPVNKLRAVASYSLGSQPVYVPVILGQTSGKYEFVFYSEDRVRFTTFEILPQGEKAIYSTSRSNPKKGETIFTWDGNAPAGRYELRYVAFIERRNEPSDRIEREIVFEHNPNWLK
jgi:flagellar basal-body rod modification protein FlgD